MKPVIRFIIFLLIIVSNTCAWSQIIPPGRRTTWGFAGHGGSIPVYDSLQDITNHGGIGDGITVNNAALQSAIAALDNQDGIIYFPPGNYFFNNTVTLRSGIVLRGAGAGITNLEFNNGGFDNLVVIAGSTTTVMSNLLTSVYKEQSTMDVEDPSLFAVNDYIKIFQDDSTLVNDDWALQSVAQVLRVEDISGNTIRFSSPLRRNYVLADSPRIRKLSMITGCGIECLKITRADHTSSGLPKSNIAFLYAAHCWIKGVESDSCDFAHVQAGHSCNIEITNSYFHGAHNYGSGKGYGIALEFSSGDCLVENNIFKHLRHSMLVQAGANGNVFTHNYSLEAYKSESMPHDLSGDIVMHGNYPYMNLFEGNIVQNILVDVSHGMNGPFNTLVRNRAELYGIIVSAGGGDSANIIGNEITGTGIGKGNYLITGNGNFEYGNNKNNTILPAGSFTFTDSSYRYTSIPLFWNIFSAWPSIGIPNALNGQVIPARQRYLSGSELAPCVALSPVIYTFTGNGNWDIAANWAANKIPPALLSTGSEIIIDPQGTCILNIPYAISPGTTITVVAGKHFLIQGNLTKLQ